MVASRFGKTPVVPGVNTTFIGVLEKPGLFTEKCLACGNCTMVCPTCYCFFINDEANRQHGTRCKGWDSCAFSCYTKMPMENPRSDKWKRVRQKVSHKYEYYPMTYGTIACTGCGRCIRSYTSFSCCRSYSSDD